MNYSKCWALLPILGVSLFFFSRTTGKNAFRKKGSGIPEELKVAIKEQMKSIKSACGSICKTNANSTVVVGKSYYNRVVKKFDCPVLLTNPVFDRVSLFKQPPKVIPQVLIQAFTYKGRAKIRYNYDDQQVKVNATLTWTEDTFQKFLSRLEKQELEKFGFPKDAPAIYRHIKDYMNVVDKHILVVGSKNPWLECMLLDAGAGRITTLEHVKITQSHPKITTLMPQEFLRMYLDGTMPEFDAAVSYSSIEHNGLGRYGDGLNPYGDLIAMARIWCVLKDGGQMLIGLPSGPDALVFNKYRVYGPLMYSHLFANWEQVYTETDPELFKNEVPKKWKPTIHILRKNLTALKKHQQ